MGLASPVRSTAGIGSPSRSPATARRRPPARWCGSSCDLRPQTGSSGAEGGARRAPPFACRSPSSRCRAMEFAEPVPAVLDHRTYVRYGPGLSASPTPPLVLEPVQTVLGEAIPLDEVAFVVVDLETTGGSPIDDAITEIGAVRFEGAARVGSFQTLVDPERPIPPAITHLTGISDRSVAGAPSLATILPTFLEFARGAVIVAHNASFDVGFLNANLLRLDYPTLATPAVCTAKLARRLVWPEVPNVRLRTLAGYFRTRVQPTHR